MNLLAILIIVFSLTVPAHAAPMDDGPASPLELTIIHPGAPDKIAASLRIVNHADHTITIQRGIEVDQLNNFKWAALMMIQAVADCGAYDQAHAWRGAVRIPAGGEVDIAPWHGWQCGEKRQCPEACDTNQPYGAGSYRFTVLLAEGERISSPSFTLPPL